MDLKSKRIFFRVSIVVYSLLYIFSIVNKNIMLTTLLKPGAILFVIFALKWFVKKEIYQQAFTAIMKILYIWLFADILSLIGELFAKFGYLDFNLVYSIEVALYFLVRLLMLSYGVYFYFELTRIYNKFQRIADLFTIISCILWALWTMFFAKDVHQLNTFGYGFFISETYKIVIMLTQGFMLLSWFHLQYKKTTLGQRILYLGLFLVTSMDLFLAFNNSYIDSLLLDAMYKLGILMIAFGFDIFEKPSLLFMRVRNEKERNKVAWKNSVYLLVYPLLVIIIVGFRSELLAFLFIFAFFITASLYIKQLDITEEILEQERTANKTLKIYSKVLEQAALSVIITDIDGNIEYVNPYFTQINGYTLDEIKGKNPRILKSGKTLQDTYTKLWNSLKNGSQWIGEFINKDKNGAEYHERAIISPVMDDNGSTYYVAIKENITEVLRRDDIIDEQERFISQLIDTIPSSIFYTTGDDIFLGANAEFDRAYGVDSKQYKGYKFDETPWMEPFKYRDFLELKEKSIEKKAPVVKQINRKANGNLLPVLYCVNAYYTKDGNVGGILGIMTDISEIKEKEEALRKALLQANDAREAKSLFIANMSHEIRTPMNAIIGMTHLALKTELTPKQKDYLFKINNAATSLLGIINDILDFSKIEAGKLGMEKVAFNLDRVILNSIELLVHKAREKNLDFLYHLSWDIPVMLIGDSLRLGQIITNLVSNAVKFTGNGGIRIDVEEERRTENRICIKFCIKDTGIGIDAININALFEPFTQSDNSITRQFGGTGLGLSICRSLVEMMGGRIWVESEVGVGSSFYFTVWLDMERERNTSNRIVLDDIKSIRTLIVDDNVASRVILQEYLEHMGFVSDVAESGNEALEMVAKQDGENHYHLLFLDWKMPQLNGIETIKKLDSMDTLVHKPYVILMTAYDKEEMIKHADYVHVDAFLEKPVSQSHLYDTILNLFTDNNGETDKKSPGENNHSIDGTKVLLAEDNEINRQIACELLEEQGCKVDVVEDGIDAVERFFKNPDKYDLILMDIQMPKLDGFEATKQIREKNTTIPIVAMTARTMPEEKEKCFKAGMNDHIAKPIEPEVLFSIIAKWGKSKGDRVIFKEDIDSKNDTDNVNTLNYLKDIYGLDVDLGLIRVGGNADFLMKLLNIFAKKKDENLDRIKLEYQKKNVEGIERVAHSLKGTAGNLGLTSIYKISAEIEEIAYRNGNTIEMDSLIERLESQLNQTTIAIIGMVDNIEKESSMAAFPGSDDMTIFYKLIGLLESGDAEAVTSFEEYSSYLMIELGRERFRALRFTIERYEFDEAVKILKRYVERG